MCLGVNQWMQQTVRRSLMFTGSSFVWSTMQGDCKLWSLCFYVRLSPSIMVFNGFNCFLHLRFAKRKLDDFVFLGNRLKVSYAPYFESLTDTKEKLECRRNEVLARLNRKFLFKNNKNIQYFSICVMFNREIFLWSYLMVCNNPFWIINAIFFFPLFLSAGRSKGSMVRNSGALTEASLDAIPSQFGIHRQQISSQQRHYAIQVFTFTILPSNVIGSSFCSISCDRLFFLSAGAVKD